MKKILIFSGNFSDCLLINFRICFCKPWNGIEDTYFSKFFTCYRIIIIIRTFLLFFVLLYFTSFCFYLSLLYLTLRNIAQLQLHFKQKLHRKEVNNLEHLN